jgi:hypothetical protein
MLFDVQQADISSRQLGRHAAHHAWGTTMQELSAMPGVELTLQQVRSVPRLLLSSSQGYGYAVAWSLAQLLQPALLQCLHAGSGAAAAAQEGFQQQHQQLWRSVLSAGSELADAVWLAEAVVALQEEVHWDKMPAGRLLPVLQAQQLWPLSAAGSDRWQVLAALLRCSLDAVRGEAVAAV